MVTFNYKYLIDSGFKRFESEDPIFFDQYGYNYFIVNKEINDHATLEWDVHTQQVELTLFDDHHGVLRRTKIQTIDEFKLLMILCKDVLNIKGLEE